METEHFDILIFGGGKGGKTLAMDQAKAGRRVAVVEAGMIGGSCINIACIPSKALIRSAERAQCVNDAAQFGVTTREQTINMPRVAARTAEVVRGMVDLNQKAFDASGFELVLGWGSFVESRVVEVTTAGGVHRLTGTRIYLNLGTRAAIPDVPGMVAAAPMTHVELLKLMELPSRLIIVGGGYIGLEMAQAFRRFGSEVVVLQDAEQIVPREDDVVGAAIQELLDGAGIEIVTGATVSRVSGRSGDRVVIETANGQSYTGSHLLVAAGRRPMTSGIGLEIAGVALTERGYIVVDDALQTTASGIWALGEVAGTAMFTHASLDDYRVAKSHILDGSYNATGRVIPSCLFIDPEFARVGLNEREAEALGVRYRKAVLPLVAVPRARTMSATTGFMQCLVSDVSDAILGFAMLGKRAGEVMTTVQIAMMAGLPYTALRDAIIAHPTMAEGLNLLFGTMPARSV